MISRLRSFYDRHEHGVSIAFFFIGFVFDILTLDRIDSWKAMLQQVAYLGITGVLIGLEFLEDSGAPWTPPAWLARAWAYREPAIHFFLGSLLSTYLLLYFKSASFIASGVFLLLLGGILALNEFRRFGQSRTPLHVGLWIFCTSSFWICTLPVLVGMSGPLPFVAALLISSIFAYFALRYLSRKSIATQAQPRRDLALPAVAVKAMLLLFYFTRIIPPVPLALRHIGIYHDVKREEGKYLVAYSRPAWKFWQSGAQTFLARPGDRIHCFVRVFSPSGFRESLRIRWLHRDPDRGWIPQDAIPFPVSGGREEGYRGYTAKANFQPGEWRVQVESADGREIGRIRFNVEPDAETGPRTMRVERL